MHLGPQIRHLQIQPHCTCALRHKRRNMLQCGQMLHRPPRVFAMAANSHNVAQGSLLFSSSKRCVRKLLWCIRVVSGTLQTHDIESCTFGIAARYVKQICSRLRNQFMGHWNMNSAFDIARFEFTQ